MAFNVTVKGFGSFTATVNGEQAVLAAEVHDASALMATMAAQGAKGDKGDTGDTGNTGPQGPQGPDGAAATITVGTTTTGAAGSEATVTNSGSTSAAVFNFTIPQGIQGIQGIQGEKGDTGDSGVAYATSPLAYDAPTKTVSINSTSPEYGSLMASTFGLPTFAGTPQITVNTAGTNTILGRDSLYAKWFTGSEVADIIGLGSAAYAATSDFYASTNPSGFITSAALTGYATESFVTSQGYITSSALSPYLTSATAASTYQTIIGMSSYYLASNPAGYVDAAGALAAVPSASTTVQGKVQLATTAEAVAGTNTAKAVVPKALASAVARRFASRQFSQPMTALSTQVSGTGAGYTQVQQYTNIGVPNAGIVGFTRGFEIVTQPDGYFYWSKPMGFGAWTRVHNATSASGQSIRIGVGYTNSPTAGVVQGDFTNKGMGMYWLNGGNVFFQFHDGTTLRQIDTGYTPPTTGSSVGVYVECFSDGTGSAYGLLRVMPSAGAAVTEYLVTTSNAPVGFATAGLGSFMAQFATNGTHTSTFINFGGNHPTFFYD